MVIVVPSSWYCCWRSFLLWLEGAALLRAPISLSWLFLCRDILLCAASIPVYMPTKGLQGKCGLERWICSWIHSVLTTRLHCHMYRMLLVIQQQDQGRSGREKEHRSEEITIIGYRFNMWNENDTNFKIFYQFSEIYGITVRFVKDIIQ